MSNIKHDIEENNSLFNSENFTKKTYTSPKLTPLIMNNVVAGGIATLNESQNGALS